MISNNCLNLSEIVAKTRQQRKCSFCKNTGHTVSNCDDLRLSGFKTYLFYMKNILSLNNEYVLLNNNTPIHNTFYNYIIEIEKMETFLYDYSSESVDNFKLIRTFACRFCSCRLRSRLQVSINKIIVYLFELNFNIIINHTFNNTHFSEELPVRISFTLTGILNNYLLMNDLSNNSSNNYEIELEYSNILSKIQIIFNKYDDSDTTIEEREKENNECSICYNDYKMINCLTFNCKHNFCGECTNKLINTKHTKCPNCRTEIDKIICYNEEEYEKIKQTKQKYILK